MHSLLRRKLVTVEMSSNPPKRVICSCSKCSRSTITVEHGEVVPGRLLALTTRNAHIRGDLIAKSDIVPPLPEAVPALRHFEGVRAETTHGICLAFVEGPELMAKFDRLACSNYSTYSISRSASRVAQSLCRPQ
jgi:hypothetical protein